MNPDRPVLLLAILVIEAAVGYPNALYRRIKHPVVWIGTLISALDGRWNHGSPARRRAAGCALLLTLVIVAGGAGFAMESLAHASWRAIASPVVPSAIAPSAYAAYSSSALATLAFILIATTLLAQRSLYDHVAAVLGPLRAGDLEGARIAVSHIVGRDTQALDAEGISTAAIESLSESFCDGIVAPAFWFLIAGVPGLFIAKAINTADSIVGHQDERHRAFGWASARADDLINLIPARLSGALICLAGIGGLKVMLRDAHRHASPNGGWPEAAMAGVLARQLGGAVTYGGEPANRAQLGDGPRPDVSSLQTALNVYIRACALLWLATAGLACLL